MHHVLSILEYLQFAILTGAIVLVSKMGLRLLAVVPAVLCTAALILSFLCLFAGSKKGFMEDYAVLTVSRASLEVLNRTNERRSLTHPKLDKTYHSSTISAVILTASTDVMLWQRPLHSQ